MTGTLTAPAKNYSVGFSFPRNLRNILLHYLLHRNSDRQREGDRGEAERDIQRENERCRHSVSYTKNIDLERLKERARK